MGYEVETFELSQFISRERGKPSKLAPGKFQVDTVTFFCPSCGIGQKEPEHGVEGRCVRCSINWEATGNTIKLWGEVNRSWLGGEEAAG